MLTLLPGFFFFFLDFIIFGLANEWLTYTLWYYFFKTYYTTQNRILGILLVCALLQDFFIFSRCGLALIIVIPVITLANSLIKTLWNTPRIFATCSLILIIYWSEHVSRWFVQGQQNSPQTTMTKIISSILLVEIILLGLHGINFLLARFTKKT